MGFDQVAPCRCRTRGDQQFLLIPSLLVWAEVLDARAQTAQCCAMEQGVMTIEVNGYVEAQVVDFTYLRVDQPTHQTPSSLDRSVLV